MKRKQAGTAIADSKSRSYRTDGEIVETIRPLPTDLPLSVIPIGWRGGHGEVGLARWDWRELAHQLNVMGSVDESSLVSMDGVWL